MKVIFNDYDYNDGNNFHYNFTGVIIDSDSDFCFYKNGKVHNENSWAQLICNPEEVSYSYYFYKDECYGVNDDFTNKSWKKKVKELKYLEELKIFI